MPVYEVGSKFRRNGLVAEHFFIACPECFFVTESGEEHWPTEETAPGRVSVYYTQRSREA